MKELTPNKENIYYPKPGTEYCDNFASIFLAGTIDNGSSVNWQQNVINDLHYFYDLPNLEIYNPRRLDWPAESNHKEIEYQIKWEQEHLDKVDMIFMIFADNSKSPITLLEMGLYAQTGKLYVFCTDKFYRFDNVKLTCDKYSIPLIETTETKEISNYIYNRIKNK